MEPSDSTPANLTISSHGDLAVVTMDDGKANAISYDMVDLFHKALDEAEGAAGLVVLGRPGVFSAGFDLAVVQKGPEAATDLMNRGAGISLRLLEWPTPVVLGVTGHALAMGAVILGCADLRIGADQDAKIGLNEVAIGLPMPRFAAEIMRERLDNRRFHEAVSLAEIYAPREAVEVGYLDRVVPPESVVDEALGAAEELVGRLDAAAFRITRATLRADLLVRLRGG